MQRCLEKGRYCQKLALARVIVGNIQHFIEDPFGNYLIQNVLKIKNDEVVSRIFAFIAGDFIRLSKLKFSSNVIEKCIDSEFTEAKHIASIFAGTHANDDVTLIKLLGKDSRKQVKRIRVIVDELAIDQFGNYVLQKAVLAEVAWELKHNILE